MNMKRLKNTLLYIVQTPVALLAAIVFSTWLRFPDWAKKIWYRFWMREREERERMNDIEKRTIVYWAGLILIGFGMWVLFIALWLYMSMNLPIFWRFGPNSILAIPLVGALIFIVIGWRMIKEDR